MKQKVFLMCIIAVVLLMGCSSSTPLNSSSDDPQSVFQGTYYANKFDHPTQLKEGIVLDVSTAPEGYFGISIQLDGKYKIQVVKDDEKYNYDIQADGMVHYYGFTLGDGEYKIRIMKNTKDSTYAEIVNQKISVKLIDEFQPFIHSSYIVSYDENSEVVKQGEALASESSDDADFLKQVFDCVTKRLSYDNKLAQTVQKGYVPDVEDVWNRKKGICYDYSCLAAVMLRSQGVPCKVIAGYVNGDYYHAWNMVYLQEEGWVVYQYSLDSNSWSRVDCTLADSNTNDYLEYEYIDSLYY